MVKVVIFGEDGSPASREAAFAYGRWYFEIVPTPRPDMWMDTSDVWEKMAGGRHYVCSVAYVHHHEQPGWRVCNRLMPGVAQGQMGAICYWVDNEGTQRSTPSSAQ